MYAELDDDDTKKLNQYKESDSNHGKIKKVDTKYIKVLNNTLNNFSDETYDIDPAKEIMFQHLKNNNSLKDSEDNSNFKKFAFNTRGNILCFRQRIEKPGDNMYLFNAETGQVYFIDRILFDYIHPKYDNYNKIITDGVKTAESNLSEIKLCISFSSDVFGM